MYLRCRWEKVTPADMECSGLKSKGMLDLGGSQLLLILKLPASGRLADLPGICRGAAEERWGCDGVRLRGRGLSVAGIRNWEENQRRRYAGADYVLRTVSGWCGPPKRWTSSSIMNTICQMSVEASEKYGLQPGGRRQHRRLPACGGSLEQGGV